jgi:predicted O-linked N-acetylglucosamine transferase (SPINDLY family)
MKFDAHNHAAAVQAAFAMARTGQLGDAEALCRSVLNQQPDQADALLLRAVIEVKTGRTAEGAESIRRSIEQYPSRPAAHALLADALLTLKRPQEALESYERALRLDSNLVSAMIGRANALYDLGRAHDAIAGYDCVLKLRPDDAEALRNRGNALLGLGNHEAAVDSFDRAIRLNPADVTALNNRGSALLSLKRLVTALSSFDTLLGIYPDHAEALHNRGCALRELGRYPAALEAFDRALQGGISRTDTVVARGDVLRELGRPEDALHSYELALKLRNDSAEAHRGSGDALLDMGDLLAALAAHDRAVMLGPDLSEAYNSRGNSLRALMRFPEAIASYDKSLSLDSSNTAAHYNRATAHLQWEGHSEEAEAGYEHVLRLNPAFPFLPGTLFHLRRSRADWVLHPGGMDRDELHQAVLSGRPVAAPLHFLSVSDSARAQRQCAKTYAAVRYGNVDAKWSRARHDRSRLRVAYVSPDLREHAVSYLMAGVFERHDAERFETIAVSLAPEEPSFMGRRLKRSFQRFMDVSGKRDTEIVDLLRSMEIDIAVDLGGFTDGTRPQIFARRIAPVQISYLGYPGTMGAGHIDYLLADEFVIPAESRGHYSEQVVYLPDCFQANDDTREIDHRISTRAQAGLPDQAFVFCCFNNTHKITPEMFDVWMRLLARIPDAVFWLLAAGDIERRNLRLQAQHRGIAPDRLVFAPRLPYSQHLGRLKLADLFLDTLPFNAGTTASDALWAGLPLLTCAGETFAARMGGSLLRAVGLPELITEDLAQYEARAIDLAAHGSELRALRQRLEQNRLEAPLFNTDRFRRQLESTFLRIWSTHED